MNTVPVDELVCPSTGTACLERSGRRTGGKESMRTIWRSQWGQLILSLILVPLLLGIVVTFAPTLVKLAGAPFWLVPSLIGVVDRASPEEVLVLPTDRPSVEFVLPATGRYVVYADESFWAPDRSLTDWRHSPLRTGHIWLRIEHLPDHRVLPITPVERGIRPYDELAAKGRPFYEFQGEAGLYRAVYVDTPPTYVAVLPDYVGAQEGKLKALMLGELALVLAYPSWRWWRRRRAEARARRSKRAEAERAWEIMRGGSND